MNHQLQVPLAEQQFVGLVYRLFSYSDRKYNIRLNFVEIISTSAANLWRVEYRFNHRTGVPLTLAAFETKLKQALGQFEVDGIWHNNSGRIYIHVLPTVTTQSTATLDRSVKVNITGSKRHRAPSTQLRNIRRAEQYRQTVAELKKVAVEKGFTQETTFIPIVKQKSLFKKFISKVKPANSVAFVSAGVEDVKPTLVTSTGSQTSLSTIKMSRGNTISIPPPKINFAAPQDLVTTSFQSDTKVYVKAKLRDAKIFDQVRRYLSIFETDAEYDYLDSLGESRLSHEIRLQSEGFPIGKELRELYYEAVHDRGLSNEKIDKDLNKLRSYEQTSRLVRLQTAREKTNRWYYSDNTLEPVDKSYHTVIKPSGSERRRVAQICDPLGCITCFV